MLLNSDFALRPEKDPMLQNPHSCRTLLAETTYDESVRLKSEIHIWRPNNQLPGIRLALQNVVRLRTTASAFTKEKQQKAKRPYDRMFIDRGPRRR